MLFDVCTLGRHEKFSPTFVRLLKNIKMLFHIVPYIVRKALWEANGK